MLHEFSAQYHEWENLTSLPEEKELHYGIADIGNKILAATVGAVVGLALGVLGI